MTYPKDACAGSPRSLKKAGTPFSTERYGIGLAKEYPQAVTAVNEALVDMMRDPGGGPSPGNSRCVRRSATEVDAMIARADTPTPVHVHPDTG